MIFKQWYTITDELYQEAREYALLSRAYTSNRHDFHGGGLNNKEQKMLEGKLGEKGFKMFLIENQVPFIEDATSAQERDEFDFLLNINSVNLKFDVKTRTKSFHTRTLEMVEQFKTHPKDIYISVQLSEDQRSIRLIGWYSKEDMLKIDRIENNGYLDNYVMYDRDLRDISELYSILLVNAETIN